MGKLNWKLDAKCRDMDVDIFFEKYEDDIGLRASIDRMCAGCPVAKECLQWGISRRVGYLGRYLSRSRTEVRRVQRT